MSFASITQRFAVWFLLIALLPILLLGYSLLHVFEQELQKSVSQQIAAISDKKVDQIDSYLRERVNDALLKAESSNTIQMAMLEFAQVYARSGVKSADYRRLDANYRDYFKRFVRGAEYYDLFLISPQGSVVYSYAQEADFATNLFDGPYRNSGLARVTHNAINTLGSSISEFEIYAPSGDAIAAFIAVPVIIKGKVAGVLALQIDNKRVYQVLLDNTGLGNTGETVVASRQDERTALVMAPLKVDPDAALKRTISLSDQRAAPLKLALNGERGSALAIDYRGVPVVAAWRYLPRMGWGMVTKMDATEAFAPLYRMRNFGLMVLGLALLAALTGAILFGRRVVAPLRLLSSNAQNIAAGNFGQRVPAAGRDELGQLARSFNTMAERLQYHYVDLEDQVRQRTADLTQIMEKMRVKDAAIESSMNAFAIADLDGNLSYVNRAFVEVWHLNGPGDAIGRSPAEFFSNSGKALAVMQTLQSIGRWQGEMNGIRPDGSVVDLEVLASMVPDSEGNPLCMMASFVDLTAHKIAEQALQKSTGLLDSIVENMPAMVFVKSAEDLRFERFNRAGEALLGFSEKDLLGKNDYDFFPREQAELFVAKDREVLASHRAMDISQEPIVTSKGETRFLHTRKIGIYNAAGEATHLLGVSIDISEKMEAEQALQRERDFASSLVNTAPMIVLLLDTKGVIEYVNPYFEQLTGYSLHEIIGKEWFSTFLPERDHETIRSLFQKSVQDAPIRGDINAILTREGVEIEIEWFSESMRDAQGKVVSILATGQDVTQRRSLELALNNTSDRLKEAQRLAKVGSWELNLLTGELVWSDEIFRLFDIDKNKFGATYEAFLNGIHPDDREMVAKVYAESLTSRKPYEVVHRLLMRDGSTKWVQELGESDFDADGTPLYSRGTVQDITERKRSEVEYQTLLKSAMDCFWICDMQGRFLNVNDAYCDLIGYNRQELLEMSIPDVEAAESATATIAHIEQILSKGADRFETRHRRKDGSVIDVEVSANFMDDGSGKIIVFLRDITERKHAEQVLKNTNEELERRVALRTAMLSAAKEEAEQANKSKSVFLSSMSHELRTPLNAILGYAQLMQLDKNLPQGVLENATEIKHAGEVLLSLMNDILDLSRIESGKAQLTLETVSLFEVIKSCLSQNNQAAMSRNITINIAESFSAYRVIADRRGLMQVLNNLISNAIKYNQNFGRVNLSCSVEVQGKVRISVMDTGLGIAADKLKQLFQSFNRLGAEMSSIEGTGIGLVISRKLIESMHGIIGVESVHGLGSTFWIELPLAGSISAAVDVVAPVVTLKPRVPRVLVAEDYAPNQNVLQLQLQTMGCEVEIAGDGAAALKMWEANAYDLILTDIDMPVMNGTEFAHAVRRAERSKGGRIPIVAITATIANSELKRYLLAGIDEVLSKPLSMDSLRNGMKRWLGDFSVQSPGPVARNNPTAKASDAAEATLDLNYLYRILGQVNLGQARILLDTFMRTANEGLKALGSQVDNAALVAKEMHKQKSSAKTVGALHYANLAATLEQQTKDKQFNGIVASLVALRQALIEVEVASTNLLEAPTAPPTLQPHALVSVSCRSALLVDDDMVVLQQVKAMLDTLGVKEVLTAVNGVEATKVLFDRVGDIEVLVCDLSMPEMDGVELIRGFGETGFKGGLILISGADEKIISTVNKLAVLQGVRVLGQLQKPVSAAQLAILLAHTSDLPTQAQQVTTGPVVSSDAIRDAMAANAFSIWFQPKVDATSMRAVGMEALARWQLPSGKFIPPDSFITVAENEGLIGELSRLLVSLSLLEASKLFKAGYPLKVAINLSGTWLNDLSLPDFILSNTIAAGLSSADVILEVTETGVMEDLTTALDVLSRLRLKGFGLSIDDFGIGYSSFEQLGRIPFTEMKLDRSFVNKGVEDAAARAILESSMDMAHKLNLATVAEGVETALDLKLVRSLGCDLVQGYFIAKPMPVSDLIVWMDKAKNK